MSVESGSRQRQHAPPEVVAGRYQLTQRLAIGGMGEVHAALDRSTGKAVALKRLRAEALAQRGVVVHFMREYHALSELRHPRIIEVYDYGVDREAPYYTMELLDGHDLRELSPLPYKDACFYLRDVASSLALLHARRLLHRDVSPRNVRRTSDGHCKLLDFGAMIAFGVPANVTGTAPCIAPEALQGAALDQRADLYSLGALAYRLLTGQHGYAVSRLEELTQAWKTAPARPKQLAREIPDELDELVMSLMNLDPMKRPNSAAEVIDWLSAIGQLAPDDVSGVARSFLTSSRLCGRDSERAQLTRRLQRAFEGNGSAALVEGQAGSGKTRLLSEAALIAQTLGLTVVRAAARPQRGVDHPVARDLVACLQQIAPLEAEAAGAKRIAWPQPSAAKAKALGRDDGGEARGRLQEALTRLFCEIASQRPLLIAVDDLEHADEFSVALLTALAHETARFPLFVVASETEGRSARHFEAAISLRSVAAGMQLSELDRPQTAELVESMFGSVPNLDRLVDWLFRGARGNPKLTVELAGHLLQRGVVRYVAGTWVLPSDEIAESVPEDVAEAFSIRLRTLSRDAVGLAELLCVRRGGATAETCLAAGAADSESVFDALDELVQRGVLESAGDEYVFAQEALRSTLQRSLAPERVRALHRRWADVLLAEQAPSVDVELEAGWHLVHTEDELRGADLLARVGPLLIERGLAMASAIPAVEKALEVYERHGRPLATRLHLRSTLALASFLFDYRLAARYGEQTLSMLYEVSGFALIARLTRILGARLGFLVGFTLMSVRRLWLPAAKRGPTPMTALTYMVRTAMGLMGVRCVALDAPGTARILEVLAPLAGAPRWTSGPVIYLACRALALQQMGRDGDVDQALRAALRVLRRGPKRDMSKSEYQNLLVGVLLADGTQECYRESSQALQRADLLESIDLRLAKAAAARVRMIYYLRRADTDRAEQYRRELDLHAIQGGTTWQVEWFAVPVEGMAGATWTDLVMLRRSLDRLERLVSEVPSLVVMRDAVRIAYHFRRGEFARAAELGERYVAEHPPRTVIGWASTYAAVAMSLVEAGQVAQAKALCERSLALVSDADRAYFAMYAPLEVAHAMALAVSGERARADEILKVRLDRLRAAGEHVSMVTIYQYQARIARLVRDRPALLQALQAMRDSALASGFPAVILLADRVAELRAKYRSSPLPPAPGAVVEREEPVDQGSAQEVTAVGTFLRGFKSATMRCGHALRMLAQCAASDEAYLFATEQDELSLIAALDAREVPAELTRAVRELIRSAREDSGLVVEILGYDAAARANARKRFRVILLPATGAGDELWVGAAAICESQETIEQLPMELVVDIGRVLSEDLRSEQISRARH
jgi:hypothetical protein